MKRPNLSPANVLHSAPLILDEARLSFVEGNRHIPFDVKRVYWLSSIDSGAVRGHHAHHQTIQMLYCITGNVDIVLDNGAQTKTYHLDASHQGILLEPMVWHEMRAFSTDATLLVLASAPYDERDYIRNYDQFLTLTKELYDSHE